MSVDDEEDDEEDEDDLWHEAFLNMRGEQTTKQASHMHVVATALARRASESPVWARGDSSIASNCVSLTANLGQSSLRLGD